jgi:NhaP-type Na+/H+ or K+/H+ antiporter
MPMLVAFVLLLFAYSLCSRRIERLAITAPMLFTLGGIALFAVIPDLPERDAGLRLMRTLSELALVLLLFTDASRSDLLVLRQIRELPVRLLTVGMFLTICLGAVGALALFDSLTLWDAIILAAILSPTDAGLGQEIVTSKQVPARIRQALGVEAGFNDGLAVPFLLFFMALAEEAEGVVGFHLFQFIGEQLGIGGLIGLAIGFGGAWLLDRAFRCEWMAESLQQRAVVSLPLLCMLVCEELGGSMFIAAFVGGLAAQIRCPMVGRHSSEFGEEWGQMLNLAVFFLFGLLVYDQWSLFTPLIWIYAVLSLTLVRILPVAVALLGTRLHRASVLFIGWFGPRGLASIVLGLIYVQEMYGTLNPLIGQTVMATVLLSIFAHGLSTLSGIKGYAEKVAKLPSDAAEHCGVIRVRTPPRES